MGFAQYTQETKANIAGSSGGGFSSFYRLNINAESQSPLDTIVVNGEQLNGHSEIVWFLTPLNNAPILNFHRSASMDNILCAENFVQLAGQCPACQHFDSITKQYEGEQRNNMPVKARQQRLYIPVYIPRRARQGHVNVTAKAQYNVFPIYWFFMDVTGYIPEKVKMFDELKQCNDSYPISMYPYKIFKVNTPKGTGTAYHFQPVAYDPATMGIYVDHPLLSPPYIPDRNNPAQKNWDVDYTTMLEYLSLLNFIPYKYPTGQVFDYAGEFQKAEYYRNLTKDWPSASKKVEAVVSAVASVPPQGQFMTPPPPFSPPVSQTPYGQPLPQLPF